jgi:hypothetical protein
MLNVDMLSVMALNSNPQTEDEQLIVLPTLLAQVGQHV